MYACSRETDKVGNLIIEWQFSTVLHKTYEPCHKKTCLRGFQPGKTQTYLLICRDYLESWNFGYGK